MSDEPRLTLRAAGEHTDGGHFVIYAGELCIGTLLQHRHGGANEGRWSWFWNWGGGFCPLPSSVAMTQGTEDTLDEAKAAFRRVLDAWLADGWILPEKEPKHWSRKLFTRRPAEAEAAEQPRDMSPEALAARRAQVAAELHADADQIAGEGDDGLADFLRQHANQLGPRR